jgi:predicted DNA-binding transcriptional regulator YafY
MLADNGERMAVYALDRMQSVALTEQHFDRPKDFSPEAYFAEYFGVMTDGTPLEHVVLRAHGKMANLLRTLPLHTSQRELEHGEGYTDFSYDIRPTGDFVGQLLSQGAGIEVLAPDSLRQQVRAMVEENLKRY